MRLQERSAVEAQDIVDEVFAVAGRDARERIWSHAFTEGLITGMTTREQLVGFLYNWSSVALEINCASAQYIYRFPHLQRNVPDVVDYFASKLIEEWTQPCPGGHQAALERLVIACGIDKQEVERAQLIPEVRGFLDGLIWLICSEPADSSIILIEEWFGEWATLWIAALDRLGIRTGEDDYWQIHRDADGRSNDDGGHRGGNRRFARSLLRVGLGPDNPLTTWPRNARTSTGMFVRVLDGCLARFASQPPDSGPAFGRSGPEDPVARATVRAMELGKHPCLTRLTRGASSHVIAGLLMNWYFLHQRIAQSFARLYHRFIEQFRGNRELAETFCFRFRDEFLQQKRLAGLECAAREVGVTKGMLADPWVIPETFMLCGFVIRLHSEGTPAEIWALPLPHMFAVVGAVTCEALARTGHVDAARLIRDGFVQPTDSGGAVGTQLGFEEGARSEAGEVRRGWSSAYIIDVTEALFENWLLGCEEQFK